VKILITGHMGFVGRHLFRTLCDQRHELTGIDLLGHDYVRPKPLVVRPSVAGRDALDFFRTDTTRYDLAIHCAAVIGGRANIDGTPLSVATNLALDSWYFRWLARTGTPRAVYFSSSAAYPMWLQQRSTGDDALADRRLLRGKLLREDDLSLTVMQRPDQTYGLAKLAGEQLAAYAEAEGTRVTIVRPFSGFGEDQATDYPFPAFIDRARRREDPFTIWGDGEQVRDWVHISDVVGATMAAVEQEVAGPVNICTGRATSFNELAKLVTSAAGYSPAFRHLPAMPSGVHYRVGDPTKLLTFYTPRVSLEDGIRRALEA
jgi:nucleoside-diphosphate-sugar epimerase